LGTVGVGVLRLLETHVELVAERAGRPVRLTAVSARDRSKDRGVDLSEAHWFADARALAEAPDVDLVLELIGGSEGVAKDLVERSLAAGKPVITANKALMAHHGSDLARQAEAAGVALAYEAAVAGGVPVIKALREGLAANRIARVYGILNGTSNFILTTMRETGREFDEVLSEAQALGYAEADPSFDVDGISALDIEYANELGYRIKLLGLSRATDGGVEQRVHPCMVALDAPIASIEGVFNAVVADGDFVGSIMAEGQGAGAGPTASAVVADLIDIARGGGLATFAVPAAALRRLPSLPMERHEGSYYLRLMVVDRPGVIADIAAALRDEDISVEAMLQRGRAPGESVPVVITTHETREANMTRALERIIQIKAVLEPPRMIRIEAL
jgi:homoserine dehydrogenase